MVMSREELIKQTQAARARNQEGRGDGILRLTKKTTALTLRILPPVEGKTASWFSEVGIHYMGEHSRVWCPRLSARKPCPICEFVEQLRNSKSTADQNKAGEWKARRRHLMWVIDRNDREARAQIFEAAGDIFDTLAANYADPAYGDITDITEGFDYLMKREGDSKTNTRYRADVRPNHCPISNDENVILRILSQVKPFSDVVVLKSEDEMFALLSPEGNPEDGGEAPSAEAPVAPMRPAIRTAAPAAAPAPAPAAPAAGGLSLKERLRLRMQQGGQAQ